VPPPKSRAWSPRTATHSSAPEQGYREALAAAGLDVDETLVRSGGFDLSALTTLEVAAELGIDVPGRLSVVGFDNVPEPALADPPLTTVQQPIRTMGPEATDMLLTLISGGEPAEAHRISSTSLVLRASTAPPPRAS
jgi:LacI family transcriptional regulator